MNAAVEWGSAPHGYKAAKTLTAPQGSVSHDRHPNRNYYTANSNRCDLVGNPATAAVDPAPGALRAHHPCAADPDPRAGGAVRDPHAARQRGVVAGLAARQMTFAQRFLLTLAIVLFLLFALAAVGFFIREEE